jgi:Nucleotidyl transferase AbiEii toxin, Type IV TA system
MALTELQRAICRLLAGSRIASGESYVAGGVALNELLGASRLSRDIDLFHDTEAALEATWSADRRLLEGAGYRVHVVRERLGMVEAEVAGGASSIRIEWARDSSFRFFPLVEHQEFGLTLHPFDLATNKVLALVGRLEVRDWIDVLECDARLQPLGYLAWAACGKDPGFSPASILEQASRTARYSEAEIAALSFAGEPPNGGVLSRRWHAALDAAQQIVAALPPQEVGHCVLTTAGDLCRLAPPDVPAALGRGELGFHPGRIRGALPRLVPD